MKKSLITIIAGLALLSLLLMLPVDVLENESTLNGGEQYSSIVPAKPPKVPPKEFK